MALWAERVRNDHNRDMKIAWQTANLTRAAKLPHLSKLLVRPPDAKSQSFDDQKAMLAMLSKQYGGRVQTVKLHG